MQREKSNLACFDIWNSDFDPDGRDCAVLVTVSV